MVKDRIFRTYSRIPRFAQRELQSPVESQDHPQAPAFNPARQPDMKPPIRTTQRPFMQQGSDPATAALTPDQLTDIRHIFDSRPLYAFDWYWEEQFYTGIRQAQAFQVPDGFTYVLRQVGIEIMRQSFNAAGESGFELSEWGSIEVDLDSQSQLIPKLQILVDGIPTPQWTPYSQVLDPTTGDRMQGVPLFTALNSMVQIETFVIVPAGSTITIFVPDFISPDSNPPTFFEFSTYVQYQGVALQTQGSDPRLDIANQTPLPVVGSE
jgi:hypothetical protein